MRLQSNARRVGVVGSIITVLAVASVVAMSQHARPWSTVANGLNSPSAMPIPYFFTSPTYTSSARESDLANEQIAAASIVATDRPDGCCYTITPVRITYATKAELSRLLLAFQRNHINIATSVEDSGNPWCQGGDSIELVLTVRLRSGRVVRGDTGYSWDGPASDPAASECNSQDGTITGDVHGLEQDLSLDPAAGLTWNLPQGP
jgi:hypothetical protein